MHIRIDRASLMQAVQRCLKIVDRRVTSPCLANILFVVEEKHIQIMATNAQMAMHIHLRGEVVQPGATSVSAQKLYDLLREWPSAETIEIMMESSRMVLRHERSRLRLNTIAADEFPSLQHVEGGFELTISASILADMIASTLFSISTDETRPHLTGLLFEVSQEHGFRVVSTDGHRLSFCQTTLTPQPEVADPLQVIVPARTAQEIRRLCDDFAGDVRLMICQDRLGVRVDAVALNSKLIDARYPLYEEVFPETPPMQTMLPNKDLDTVLRRCLVVADGANHDVILQFSSNAVHITASNHEQEQVDDFLTIQYSDEPLQMGFNGNYLRDVLSVIKSDQVPMQFSGVDSPVIFTEQAFGVDKRFVVMPLRLN